MLLKLVLLVIYILVLFTLSRLLEAVSWFETGYLASKLLDPVSLSVKKLKLLLDQRGVSYAGVVEKRELTNLVETSGDVVEGELDQACIGDSEVTTQTSSSTTNFSSGLHFYEQVEDCKDSVWLVQVLPGRGAALLSSREWQMLVQKVSRFGIRLGMFDCALDQRLCNRKSWHTSRLVLALPKGFRAKDDVALQTYTGSTKMHAIFDWVNSNLASRIKEVHNMEELRKYWYNFDQANEKAKVNVHALMVTKTPLPPMFYSALSVKFTGRVKFGLINTQTPSGQKILDNLNLGAEPPLYLIITPENNHTYGMGYGEYFNFKSMETLLRTLQPEGNDLFIAFLFIVNVTSLMHVFLEQGNVFVRLGNQIWITTKYNCILLLLWLPIIGLLQLPYLSYLTDFVMKSLRIISSTHFVGLLRKDWYFYTNHLAFVIATFIVFGILVGYVHFKINGGQRTDSNNNATWWSVPWDQYLFRPSTSITRPMGNSGLDLEEGMELLIERLAMPNLWLQPVISYDYIKDLPVWQYFGVNAVESDSGSDVDAPCGNTPLTSPLFKCEKCLEDNGQLKHEHKGTEEACANFIMDGNYRCMCGGTKQHNDQDEKLVVSYKTPGNGKQESQNKKSSKGQTNQSKHHIKKSECAQRKIASASNPMPAGVVPCSECVICLENYEQGILLCGLPCGHSFHHNCIMLWLTSDNHCCPVCRWPPYKSKPCKLHLHSE